MPPSVFAAMFLYLNVVLVGFATKSEGDSRPLQITPRALLSTQPTSELLMSIDSPGSTRPCDLKMSSAPFWPKRIVDGSFWMSGHGCGQSPVSSQSTSPSQSSSIMLLQTSGVATQHVQSGL